MKRIRLVATIALTLTAVILAYGQSIKKEGVTAEVLDNQPAGKPYILDLTRKGIVYEVATGIDYSRAAVRTSTGEQPMSALVKKLGLTGKFLLGTWRDLSAIDFGFALAGGTLDPPGDGSSEAKCDTLVCTCNGRQDCSDLSKTGKCGEAAACGIGKGGKPGRWGCTCTKR